MGGPGPDAPMDQSVERAEHRHKPALTGQALRQDGRLAAAIEAAYRDRWRILGAVVAGLLVTDLAAVLVTPQYTADAELLVLPASGAPSPAATTPHGDALRELDILRSRPLADAVIASIGPQLLYPGVGPEAAATRFASRFSANGDGSGTVVVVRFSHPDPAIAAQVVNRAVAIDLAMRARLYDDGRQRLLTGQVATRRGQLDAAERAYADFTAAHGSRFDTGIDILLHRRDSLEHDLDQARSDLARARAGLPEGTTRPDRLQTQQEVAGAGARQAIASQRLDQVGQELRDLEAQEPEFQRLQRQRNLAATAWEAAAQALDQSRIPGSLDAASTSVRVIQPAVMPVAASSLRLLMLSVGGLLSLLAGLATALLCARFRRGFNDPGRLERELGLPVLTSLPEWPRPARALALTKATPSR